MKSNVPIRPEQAMEFAWALTHLHSDDKNLHIYAEWVHKYLIEIEKRVKNKGNKNDIEYIDNLRASIDSCVRTLGIIIRGRNLNFEENDKLRKKNIAEKMRLPHRF